MPVKSELFERPPSIRSGETLKQNVVIQTRSEVLLEEQANDVKNMQEVLQRTFVQLDFATNPEEESFYRNQIKELKQKSEEMIVILKILHKLNRELAYARADLKKELKYGGNINKARKRVNWLEDRMEKLLGKKRQGSPRRPKFESPQYESSIHSSQPKQEDCADSISPQSAVIEDGHVAEDTHLAMVEGTHHGETDKHQEIKLPCEDVIQNDSNVERPPVRDMRTPESSAASNCQWQSLLDQIGPDIPSDHTSRVYSLIKALRNIQKNQDLSETERMRAGEVLVRISEVDDLSSLTEEQIFVMINDISNKKEEEEIRDYEIEPVEEEVDQKVEPDLEQRTESCEIVNATGQTVTVVDIRMKSSESGSLVSDDSDHGDVITSPREAESVDSTSLAEGDDNSENGVPVFITEQPSSPLSRATKRSKSSRVTIRSPAEDYEIEENEEDSSEEPDAGDEYWKSEHHRFEFSDYQPLLLDINPLSYHQMGLAVPGCFVEKRIDQGQQFPWKTKKSQTEVTDVHGEALEKLSMKVHRMYDRVHAAAMLSVNPSEKERMIAPTFMQNIDLDAPIGESTENIHKASLTKHGLQRPSSRETIVFPPLNQQRLGSSMSGRLVYHPKPLAYPKKLPLTRTMSEKVFPRSSENFSQSVPEVDEPAERVADQRNLLKETKFANSLHQTQRPLTNSSHNTQKHMQQLLEGTPSPTREKGRDLRSTFNLAKAMVKLKDSSQTTSSESLSTVGESNKWNEMKPESGLAHSGLKWERVKGIVHNNLTSENVDERVDAARHLGGLKCGDTMVMYALKQRLQVDTESRVVYEVSKALVTLGCWEEEIVAKVNSYLLHGHPEVKVDMMKTITNGKNVHFVDKKMKSVIELTRILNLLCKTEPDADNMVAVHAAICLGRLCVRSQQAIDTMMTLLENSKNSHLKAQALDILVWQLNQTEWDIVCAVLDQLKHSPVWKYRRDAAKMVIHLGKSKVLRHGYSDWVFDKLQQKLWDDPSQEVKREVARSFAALELFPQICEKIEKKLDDPSEAVRSQAVISAGTLGMKSERILKQLLEMLELDPSEYVRLMVVRTFGILKCPNKRIVRNLKEKEKGEGPFAKEARRSLGSLRIPNTQATTLQVARSQ